MKSGGIITEIPTDLSQKGSFISFVKNYNEISSSISLI